MEDYKTYECPKCQIRKHILINEKFDFKCKCCGINMKYIGVVRKNQLEPFNKDNYYKNLNMESTSHQFTPKCPICQSTNLSKISATKKVAKIAMFGIFGMGDNGKTWKCNNCGSKF